VESEGPAEILTLAPVRMPNASGAREGPPLYVEIVRPLTEADLRSIDQFYIDRMDGIADKR
jgi:hypothetical protein